MVGLAKTEKDLKVSGSFDHIAPIEQMRSVDEAMRLYQVDPIIRTAVRLK